MTIEAALYISKRMNGPVSSILQLAEASTLGGGMEKHTRLLAQEMARRGFKVILACPPGPEVVRHRAHRLSGLEIAEVPGIANAYTNPLKLFHARRLVSAVRDLRRLIAENRIDLIHSHMHMADLLALLSRGGNPGVRLVTTIHALDGRDGSYPHRVLRRPLIRTVLKRFDRILCVSEDVRRITRDYFGLDEQRIITAPNAIDLSELKPSESAGKLRADLSTSPDGPVLFSAGRLHHRKGQDLLLRAAQLLMHRGYGFTLWIAGADGGRRKHLEKLCRHLSLQDRVRFLGFRGDMVDLLAASDLYIQPSRWDPLPRALMEAMGMGRCCIASRVNGIPEVITHEQDGLLFEAEDVQGLTRNLARALDDPSWATKLGQAAARRIKERHTIQRMVDDVLSAVGAPPYPI